MPGKKYIDPFPHKNIRNPQELEIRLRRLTDNDNDLRAYLDSFFAPTESQIWVEGGTQVGARLNGSSNFGIMTKAQTPVVIGSDAQVIMRHGHYFDGKDDRYSSAGAAYQIVLWRGGSLEGQPAPFFMRRSTGTPVKDGVVSWLPDVSVIPLSGSGVNGSWVRYPDGTQQCWHRLAYGTIGLRTWTYQKAFSAAPVVQATPSGIIDPGDLPGLYSVSIVGLPGVTTVTVLAKGIFGSPPPSIFDSSAAIDLFATGRWY